MSTSKIAITLNSEVLSEVDALVKKRMFSEPESCNSGSC